MLCRHVGDALWFNAVYITVCLAFGYIVHLICVS